MGSRIFMTGGSGLLGQEIQKHIGVFAPSSKEFDILYPKGIDREYDVVIHSAAYTDVTKAETDRKTCFDVNVNGTINMLKLFPEAYFVYISTEYCNNPVNFYSYTKLWGEDLVKKHKNHLIIRTLFKPNPFPYEYAFIDQYTQGDYVDVIAPMIVKEIILGSQGTITLGTGRKNMFELARRTRPDIKGIMVDDIKGVKLPKDY